MGPGLFLRPKRWVGGPAGVWPDTNPPTHPPLPPVTHPHPSARPPIEPPTHHLPASPLTLHPFTQPFLPHPPPTHLHIMGGTIKNPPRPRFPSRPASERGVRSTATFWTSALLEGESDRGGGAASPAPGRGSGSRPSNPHRPSSVRSTHTLPIYNPPACIPVILVPPPTTNPLIRIWISPLSRHFFLSPKD